MPLFDTPVDEAWFWLGCSWLLAVIWTNLTWLFSPWTDREDAPSPSASLAESIVFRLTNWRFASPLLQGFRLLYFVGLPFAALFWGRDAVIAQYLGLQGVATPAEAAMTGSDSLVANWSDWLSDLGWGAVLGGGSLGLLLLAAVTYRRALQGTESSVQHVKTPIWSTLREGLYQEIHWAFYRNAPIVAFGMYWGTWGGLALVGLEAVLNPMWRADLGQPARAWSRLSGGALAVISAITFLHTQNLWLTLLLHWGISRTLEAARARPLRSPRGTHPPEV